MAKKELRKLRAESKEGRTLANYIATLQRQGKINTYLSKDGYVMYEELEYKAYKKTVHTGRPLKYIDRVIKEN